MKGLTDTQLAVAGAVIIFVLVLVFLLMFNSNLMHSFWPGGEPVING
jgi:hypothetical protein